MDLPIKSIQQDQLAALLHKIIVYGAGRLEIRIEKGELRWLRPSLRIYNPTCQPYKLVEPKPLAHLMGEWMSSFQLALNQVLGAKFGSLVIGVEHGEVVYIEATPDVRIHSGTTGPFNTESLQVDHNGRMECT